MRQAGQVELSMMFGTMTNAVPTAFWLLGIIYTFPGLLDEVRQELERSDLVRIDGPSRIISISGLKTHCPLLVSLFRECIRIYASNTSARQVLKDTLVADKYLLKRGCMVQIAGDAIHRDHRIWGADVGEINPYRFVHSLNGTFTGVSSDEKGKTIHPAAYRGFGGGSSLCPGRHFAQTEIVGFAAMVAMGWNLLPIEGDQLVLPLKKEPLIPLGVFKPDGGMSGLLRRRPGFEHVEWSFEA